MDFEQAKRFIQYLPVEIEQQLNHDLVKVTIDQTVYYTDLRGLDLVIHTATKMYKYGYQNGSDYALKIQGIK